MTWKYRSYCKTFLKILLVAWMAVVIPMSCAGGGSDEDIPKPQPTPQPQPEPEPAPDITGLESMMWLPLQVDQECDLLSGITLNNGASLEKVELMMDGVTSEIADPKHFIPEYLGPCTIILTVKDKDGKSTPYQVENLTIKPINYKTMVHGIDATYVTVPSTSAIWYTVDGLRLDGKPTKPGVYIVNGQKVIVK